MNGCNWQNKSFSVVMEGKEIFTCRECNSETDGTHKYNGDILCKKCFDLKGKKLYFSDTGFFTTKDKKYEFTTEMFDGKLIEIRSRSHFKKLLKKYGMADASPKECRDEANFRKRINEEDTKRNRRLTAETIYSKMRDRGQLSGRK